MTHTNFVVVSGATGTTGRAVIDSLIAVNIPVRALVRDVQKAAKLLPQNNLVELYHLETLDNVPALIKAYTGARGAYVLSPSASQAIRISGAHAEAAVAVKLPLVVYLSTSFIAFDHGKEHNVVSRLHEHAENTFRVFGIPSVNLRPDCFFTNHLQQVFKIQTEGIITNVTFDQQIPAIDPRDIGDVAAKVFLEGPEKHAGKDYYLTTEKDQALTASQQTEIISKAIGKPLKTVNLTAKEWRIGKENYFTEFDLVSLSDGLANQRYNFKPHQDVRKLLGRAPRSFEDFVQDNLHIFRQ